MPLSCPNQSKGLISSHHHLWRLRFQHLNWKAPDSMIFGGQQALTLEIMSQIKLSQYPESVTERSFPFSDPKHLLALGKPQNSPRYYTILRGNSVQRTNVVLPERKMRTPTLIFLQRKKTQLLCRKCLNFSQNTILSLGFSRYFSIIIITNQIHEQQHNNNTDKNYECLKQIQIDRLTRRESLG